MKTFCARGILGPNILPIVEIKGNLILVLIDENWKEMAFTYWMRTKHI
jgi:hypothetical protein